MTQIWTIGLALLLDGLMGDPPRLPHPVVGMGKFISIWEKYFYSRRKRLAFLSGALMAVILISFVFLGTSYLLKFLENWNTGVKNLVIIFLGSQCLALRGLVEKGALIAESLLEQDLLKARFYLSHIVGRDTAELNEDEIIRACVESLAENLSDGVIAPLFYFFCLGLPGVLAYKAVNTMDSMVGYLNEHYEYFGRFAARCDDIANWVPARISGLLIVLAACFYPKTSGRRALICFWQQGHKHISPNAGYPEAAAAGALGVVLGGDAYYKGELESRSCLKGGEKPLSWQDIKKIQYLDIIAAWLAFFIMSAVIVLIK